MAEAKKAVGRVVARPVSRKDRAEPAGPANGGGGITLGTLAAGSTPGRLLVIAPPRLRTPVAARTTVRFAADEIAHAVATAQPVALCFEDGDPAHPIALGLVQSETPLLDAILALPEPVAPATARVVARGRNGLARREAPSPGRGDASAVVDGKRFVLEGYEEVVLRCGDASITLSRNGRILIRGAYVETHAKGTNRIKGGAVKIN